MLAICRIRDVAFQTVRECRSECRSERCVRMPTQTIRSCGERNSVSGSSGFRIDFDSPCTPLTLAAHRRGPSRNSENRRESPESHAPKRSGRYTGLAIPKLANWRAKSVAFSGTEPNNGRSLRDDREKGQHYTENNLCNKKSK